MATYYVRTSGSDTNTGLSPSAAWATPAKAVASIASGDTVYFGAGKYRFQSFLQITANNAVMTYMIGDTDGSKTGDAGEILFTPYYPDDQTPSTQTILYFNAAGNWTFRRLSLLSSVTAGNVSSYCIQFVNASNNIVFQDCTIQSTASAIYMQGSNASFAQSTNLTIERCRILCAGKSGVELQMPSSATGPDYKANILIRNCLIVANTGVLTYPVSVQTYSTGGIVVNGCTIISGNAAAQTQGSGNSLTYPMVVTNSYLNSFYGVAAGVSGQLVETNNFIQANTTRLNVASGAGTLTGVYRSPWISLGHQASYGGVVRPFGEIYEGLLTGWLSPGTNPFPSDDINGVTRPASGSKTGGNATPGSIGAFERSNSGVRDDSLYRTSTPSLRIDFRGYHEFEVPVASVPTTISVWVYVTSWLVNNQWPWMEIVNGGECGVADMSVALPTVSPADQWNQISLGPFTPTSAGIITVRLWSNTRTTSVGTLQSSVWFDDFNVS